MPGKIIAPGPSLVQAARALQTTRRGFGVFPCQWIIPGPNSRHVLATDGVAMPAAYGAPATVLTYTVEQGFRFSLRGIFFNSTSPDWNVGSGDVIFDLAVIAGTGPRKVDYFFGVKMPLGSPVSPFPILGRLEFAELEQLQLTVTAVATVTLGAGFAFGGLVGHTYPESEAIGAA